MPQLPTGDERDQREGLYGSKLVYDSKYSLWVPRPISSVNWNGTGSPYDAWQASPDQMQAFGFSEQMAYANPDSGFISPAGTWTPNQSATGGAGGGPALSSQYIFDQAYKDSGSGQMELDTLNKQYGTLADDLKAYYGDAAKRAGTYSGTGEFDAGLKYQTAQGYSGAEYALRNRMNALNRALGKDEIGQSVYDPKTGMINKLPFQASNPASGIDNPTNAVGIGTAPTNDVGGNVDTTPSLTGTFGTSGVTQEQPTTTVTPISNVLQQPTTTNRLRRTSTISRYEGR